MSQILTPQLMQVKTVKEKRKMKDQSLGTDQKRSFAQVYQSTNISKIP